MKPRGPAELTEPAAVPPCPIVLHEIGTCGTQPETEFLSGNGAAERPTRKVAARERPHRVHEREELHVPHVFLAAHDVGVRQQARVMSWPRRLGDAPRLRLLRIDELARDPVLRGASQAGATARHELAGHRHGFAWDDVVEGLLRGVADAPAAGVDADRLHLAAEHRGQLSGLGASIPLRISVELRVEAAGVRCTRRRQRSAAAEGGPSTRWCRPRSRDSMLPKSRARPLPEARRGGAD